MEKKTNKRRKKVRDEIERRFCLDLHMIYINISDNQEEITSTLFLESLVRHSFYCKLDLFPILLSQ